MSDVKFTPGPWVIGDENSSSVEVCIGDVLASIDREGPHFNEMKITRDEMRANAHLIAAAPDMYSLLSDILKNYECGDIVDQEIQSVLAQARGEQP